MRHYNPGHIPHKEPEPAPAPEKHFHTTEQHHHHYLPPTRKRRDELFAIAELLWRVILFALVLWLALGRAHAQQVPNNYDASGNLLVNVAAGGGSGGTSSTFGGSFPGTGTAAGFKDGGGLMQPGLLDASGFLKMNCAAGCSGAADNSATGTLNSGSGAGNTLAIAIAGDNSVAVTLPAGNTLVATMVAEYSSDNQTTWQATSLRAPGAQWVANVAVSSTQNTYNIQIPGGAGHIRVRLSAFTSGSATAVMRAVGQPELVPGAGAVAGSAIPAYLLMIGGSDGTNARALAVSAAGAAKVDGSAVTQPISAASLPLPTGAATAAKQPAIGTAGTASPDVITVQGVTSMTPLKTDGSATTQPVSAASLPLPSGASTAAKQPALGTAGTASGDVITIQGVASMTAVKVDGSAVTQPVSAASLPLPSGASTAAKQPALGTAGSPSADVITIQGVTSMTALKVDGSGVTQPVSAASLPLPTGAAADSSVTGLEVAQASTTSGQKGVLTQCAVTTNAPSYTTAQTDPCSLDVSGLLRVSLKDTPSNTNAFNVQGTLADNGAAAGTNRVAILPAIAESNMPAAATAGRNAALRTDLQGNLLASLVPNGLTTYAANKQGLATVASPTDIAVLPGNATNTVIATKVMASCTQTTAGVIDIQLIKRSTADTAGTSGAMTAVPLDSGNAAAVSAPLSYTANPTTGTAVGNIDSQKIGAMAAGTASPNDIYIWKPGYGQAVVLRGTAQQLAVNLAGVTLTGGSCDITFEWIETTGL